MITSHSHTYTRSTYSRMTMTTAHEKKEQKKKISGKYFVSHRIILILGNTVVQIAYVPCHTHTRPRSRKMKKKEETEKLLRCYVCRFAHIIETTARVWETPTQTTSSMYMCMTPIGKQTVTLRLFIFGRWGHTTKPWVVCVCCELSCSSATHYSVRPFVNRKPQTAHTHVCPTSAQWK